MQRVLAALDAARGQPLQDSLAALLRGVDEWSGPVPPHDDISVLAVELA